MRVPWQCVTLCYAQVVNHFSKATSITTKSGLMKSLRQLRWFEPVDIDTFFPRCYDLSDPGDYADFVEDYKATVAERQLKRVVVAVVAAAGGYTGAGAGAGAGAGTGAGAGAGAGAAAGGSAGVGTDVGASAGSQTLPFSCSVLVNLFEHISQYPPLQMTSQHMGGDTSDAQDGLRAVLLRVHESNAFARASMWVARLAVLADTVIFRIAAHLFLVLPSWGMGLWLAFFSLEAFAKACGILHAFLLGFTIHHST